MSGKREQMQTLEQRLRDGFEKIGAAMQEGRNVANWERTWIDLLRDYEELSDELAAAQPEQSALPLGNVERAA